MREIKNNVFYCGVADTDRKVFDELIPLPDGTSYNSYFVLGSEKTALIDTSYSTKIEQYLKCLDVKTVDYIVSNHGEGDHTDALATVLERFPNAKILTNQKCKDILVDAREIPDERFQVISDNEEVSLGDKTLQFMMAPFVHWPDTMFTYIKEDKILFTCDFLGAHHSMCDGMFAPQTPHYLEGARRYFGEIMMPFRTQCQNYIKKIDALSPDIICPSHGGVYDNPSFILDAYRDWTSDIPCNKAVLAYVSMYGNTESAMKYLKTKLNEEGVDVDLFNLAKEDIGEYVCALVDAATLVLGASMVLSGPHPVGLNAAVIANALRPNIKTLGVVGSFGWGGNLGPKMQECINLKVEKFEPVLFKGKAKEADFKKLDALAKEIAQKHLEIGVR